MYNLLFNRVIKLAYFNLMAYPTFLVSGGKFVFMKLIDENNIFC